MRLAFVLVALWLVGVAPSASSPATAFATASIDDAPLVDVRAAGSGPAHVPLIAFAPRRVLLVERVLGTGALTSADPRLHAGHIGLPTARWRRGPPRIPPDAPDH